MKPSEAMLKGFEMAGERQCMNNFFEGSATKPTAVCALAAITLAMDGTADYWAACADTALELNRMNADLDDRFDDDNLIANLNNGWNRHRRESGESPMSIPDIAGILAAEGY